MNDPTNNDRADWALEGLETFKARTRMHDEELETIIGDFLTDLLHLCTREEIDFSYALNNAMMHYREEVEEERP